MKTSMFLLLVFLFCVIVLVIVYFKESTPPPESSLQNSTSSQQNPFDQLPPGSAQKELKRRRDSLRKIALRIWEEYSRIIGIITEESSRTKVGFEPNFRKNAPKVANGSIVASAMTTLWIMKLNSQFEEGKRWLVGNKFQLEHRIVSSLASCYALTNDSMFLEKALELPDSLNSSSLEARYLAHLTNETRFLRNQKFHNLTELNFSQNLLRLYLQSNGTDPESLEQYKSGLDSADQAGLFPVYARSGHTFALTYFNQTLTPYMDSGSCYLGAMLALGAVAMNRTDSRDSRIQKHWALAQNLTETCRFFSEKIQNGEPRQPFTSELRSGRFRGMEDLFLGPQLAESYFVLYRLTNNSWYRQYAWNLVQTIERLHQNSDGFYGISIEKCKGVEKDVYLPLSFMSQSLKFLYLIFADRDVYPLDQWIWNENGDLFPVL